MAPVEFKFFLGDAPVNHETKCGASMFHLGAIETRHDKKNLPYFFNLLFGVVYIRNNSLLTYLVQKIWWGGYLTTSSI